MTTDAARALAETLMAEAATMNASYEHIPSKNKAFLAGTVMDLCSQLDAAHAQIAALTQPAPAAGSVATASEADIAMLADEHRGELMPDAHVGAVGGE